jgi:hypothetical protein
MCALDNQTRMQQQCTHTHAHTFCLALPPSLSLSHTHTLSLSHTHTHTHTHNGHSASAEGHNDLRLLQHSRAARRPARGGSCTAIVHHGAVPPASADTCRCSPHSPAPWPSQIRTLSAKSRDVRLTSTSQWASRVVFSTLKSYRCRQRKQGLRRLLRRWMQSPDAQTKRMSTSVLRNNFWETHTEVAHLNTRKQGLCGSPSTGSPAKMNAN